MIFEFGIVIVLGGGLLIAREVLRLQWEEKQQTRRFAEVQHAMQGVPRGEARVINGVPYTVSSGRIMFLGADGEPERYTGKRS
jgi:hypothetical protein